MVNFSITATKQVPDRSPRAVVSRLSMVTVSEVKYLLSVFPAVNMAVPELTGTRDWMLMVACLFVA